MSERSILRSVAVPTEHGGWGLTLEPVLLGLIVASSGAGALLGLAAFIGFVARTPLKVVLVDVSRDRRLHRTNVAAQLLTAELLVLVVLVLGATRLADAPFWAPLVVAAPLVLLELWFDMRSRSRRLLPELAGSIGIASTVAMIVLADGGSARLAVGLWVVLAARSITSIPFVRAQVGLLHGHTGDPTTLLAADLVAIGLAVVGTVLDPSLLAGAVTIAVIVAFQRVGAQRPVPRATVVGIRQMVLGLVLVATTSAGVLAT
jgi:hypothetical protein